MKENEMVICASSFYEKKYFLAKQFHTLPKAVQEELQIMCVKYTEEIGGIFVLKYDREGKLLFQVSSKEGDFSFDEIGSALKIKQLQQKKQALLESLELYCRFLLAKEV